ncbi:DUF445 domain-containing protein [Novilysobacter avium]|nr:DUF445 domain-containing protein [Lysobacter avium]
MLAVAAAVFAVGTWLRITHPHWGFDLLVAMAEAAMVGGLADWFAVVALFRHPLGQRWIPHTAIIPNKKVALGRALANFISDHFLESGEVLRRVEQFDPGKRLAAALANPVHAQTIGKFAVNVVPHLLQLMDSERLHRFLLGLVREQLQRADVADLGSQLLEVMTQDRRHQALLDSVLRDLGDVLADEDTQHLIASKISPQLWSVLRLTRLDDAVAEKLAAKIIAGISDLISDMAEDPSHELRLRFDDYVDAFIDRLRTDPSLQQKVSALRDRVLDDPALARYLRQSWIQVLDWVRDDLQRDDSAIAGKVADASRAIGDKLGSDPEVQGWLNRWVLDTLGPLIDKYRGAIRDFIVERVERWDTRELVRELELSVGSDLQYIRYNGTAIGALIGGLLYATVRLIEWLA